MQPSSQPSMQPTSQPTIVPSMQPTSQPTMVPSMQPTSQPTTQPSSQPTTQPTTQPSGQPTSYPSSSPSYIKNEMQFKNDGRRFRTPGTQCENECSGHGQCKGQGSRCTCFKDANGEDEWTGVDCSLRACSKGAAWTTDVLERNNDAHPWVECSNRGTC